MEKSKNLHKAQRTEVRNPGDAEIKARGDTAKHMGTANKTQVENMSNHWRHKRKKPSK